MGEEEEERRDSSCSFLWISMGADWGGEGRRSLVASGRGAIRRPVPAIHTTH